MTKLEKLLDPAGKLPDVLILEMHQTINMDNTGLDALESLQRLISRRGGLMMIAGANEQPLMLMKRSGFVKRLGEDNLRSSLEDALYIVGAPRNALVERNQHYSNACVVEKRATRKSTNVRTLAERCRRLG